MDPLVYYLVDKNDTSWSMRPWLVLVHFGIPFEEVSFVASDAQTPERIRAVSKAGTVPILRMGETIVHESLAILETLADLYPEHAIWPRDREARARARCIASEMHAGFRALRTYHTMNLALRTQASTDAPRRAELARFEEIVADARKRVPDDGGPFLFGAFSAADAMLAPMATRIVSYGLPASDVTRAWIEAVYALPAFQRWEREATEENRRRPPAARIGVPFDGSLAERIPEAPRYAVIFESTLASESKDYSEVGSRMEELARSSPGYIGHSSARNDDGTGLTVSYWASLDDIAAFRANIEHGAAQKRGREIYYASYELCVAQVVRARAWKRDA